MQFEIVFVIQKSNCQFQGQCLPSCLYILANSDVVNHMLQSGGGRRSIITEPTILHLKQSTMSV